jgi:serine/threonine-protein kinase
VLSPGNTFAGYEVESVVGAGGLGILYRARQLRLDRPVALKLVEPDVARHPVVRERLRREARAVASLDHPNVVPLY